MQDNFEQIVDFVIDHLEGGDRLVKDSGGWTRYGISSRAHPTVDVRSLTRAGAENIYRTDYWNTCRCNDLPWPHDLIVFDTAVNQGVTFAKEVRCQTQGPEAAILMRIERYAEIAGRRGYGKYFRGWVNRVLKIWHLAEQP